MKNSFVLHHWWWNVPFKKYFFYIFSCSHFNITIMVFFFFCYMLFCFYFIYILLFIFFIVSGFCVSENIFRDTWRQAQAIHKPIFQVVIYGWMVTASVRNYIHRHYLTCAVCIWVQLEMTLNRHQIYIHKIFADYHHKLLTWLAIIQHPIYISNLFIKKQQK